MSARSEAPARCPVVECQKRSFSASASRDDLLAHFAGAPAVPRTRRSVGLKQVGFLRWKETQMMQWRLSYGLAQVDDVKIERAEIVCVDGNIRRKTEEETIAGAA